MKHLFILMLACSAAAMEQTKDLEAQKPAPQEVRSHDSDEDVEKACRRSTVRLITVGTAAAATAISVGLTIGIQYMITHASVPDQPPA